MKSEFESYFDGQVARALLAVSGLELAPDTSRVLADIGTELDRIGRLPSKSEAPLIDEHTLRTALERWMGPDASGRIVDTLQGLPGRALRTNDQLLPPPAEIPWLNLANRVVIFDPTSPDDLEDLRPSDDSQRSVMIAVQTAFPSLELELVEPALQRALVHLAIGPHTADYLAELNRQLGWWAAAAGSLLMGSACAYDIGGKTHYWPLVMYLYATAIGGWTLTVVGSVALVPVA